jgi:hypothetical protein
VKYNPGFLKKKKKRESKPAGMTCSSQRSKTCRLDFHWFPHQIGPNASERNIRRFLSIKLNNKEENVSCGVFLKYFLKKRKLNT